MTKISAKMSAAVAMAVVFASTIVPAAFAATAVTVNNNGASSVNSVWVKNKNTTLVKQKNTSVIGTSVNAISKTGGNNADFNTGGNSGITTGEALTAVGVTVGGSTNSAALPECGCQTNTNSVDINHNGAFSVNSVHVVNNNTTTFKQSNSSVIWTEVDVKTSTGNNSASFNTGGTTTVNTGPATTGVTVDVTGSSNTVL